MIDTANDISKVTTTNAPVATPPLDVTQAAPVTATELLDEHVKPAGATSVETVKVESLVEPTSTSAAPAPAPKVFTQPRTPDGKFLPKPPKPPEPPKRRGRPPGSKNKTPGEQSAAQLDTDTGAPPDFSDIDSQTAPPVAPVEPAIDYGLMAGGLFDLSANALAMTFGPEWQPQSPNERQNVVDALAAYLRSKQVQDLPPGVMLCFVIAFYSAPRLQQPTTSSKLKVAWAWLKTKFRKRSRTEVLKHD